MDVSENSGTPQIIHFNRVFHCKPSILGYPYFWKHPYGSIWYVYPSTGKSPVHHELSRFKHHNRIICIGTSGGGLRVRHPIFWWKNDGSNPANQLKVVVSRTARWFFWVGFLNHHQKSCSTSCVWNPMENGIFSISTGCNGPLPTPCPSSGWSPEHRYGKYSTCFCWDSPKEKWNDKWDLNSSM